MGQQRCSNGATQAFIATVELSPGLLAMITLNFLTNISEAVVSCLELGNFELLS